MKTEMGLYTHYQNGDETGKCSIPITIAGRFANENRVENEITQAKFNATCNDTKYLRMSQKKPTGRKQLVGNVRSSASWSVFCCGCAVVTVRYSVGRFGLLATFASTWTCRCCERC